MATKERTPAPAQVDEQVSFTLPATELIRVFHNGLLAANKDDTRPVICALRLEYGGAELKVIATDHYRLATDTAVIEGDPVPGGVLVARDDADAIVKMLKTVSKGYHFPMPATVKIGPLNLSVEAGIGCAQVYTARLVEGEFPNWRRLMPEENSSKIEPTTHIGLNPRFLADYAKVLVEGGGANTPLKLEFNGPTRPVRVTYGRTYVGLLMPIRLK